MRLAWTDKYTRKTDSPLYWLVIIQLNSHLDIWLPTGNQIRSKERVILELKKILPKISLWLFIYSYKVMQRCSSQLFLQFMTCPSEESCSYCWNSTNKHGVVLDYITLVACPAPSHVNTLQSLQWVQALRLTYTRPTGCSESIPITFSRKKKCHFKGENSLRCVQKGHITLLR